MLRTYWKRLILRGARYSSNYSKINLFYLFGDPWNMSSLIEEYRFSETNRIISNEFGKINSLLEVGCGEGHQSLYLKRISERLIGIDVSQKAINRARKRCPESEFFLGDVFSCDLVPFMPFDLVVACEVLYYMNNLPLVLAKMKTLGKYCFVSYFSGEIKNLDPLFLSQPNVKSKLIAYRDTSWRIVFWQNS